MVFFGGGGLAQETAADRQSGQECSITGHTPGNRQEWNTNRQSGHFKGKRGSKRICTVPERLRITQVGSGFSISELFGSLGWTQWETESVPLFSSHPAVPFGIGEDRAATGVIVAPIRSTRASRPSGFVPEKSLAGPAPGRRHPLVRCRVEEVEEVLSHADCS